MNKHYPHLADKLPAPSQKLVNIRSLILRWWAREDSNFQPNDYQLLAREVPEVSGFALRTLCLPN